MGEVHRMAREIAKAYEPQQIEPRWAEFWVKEELFKAAPHARVQHAVLAGNGPCLHLDATGGGEAIDGSRDQLPRLGPRRIPEKSLEMERRVRGNHYPADETDWRELRLVARKVHPFAGIVARGYRGVRSAA